MSTLQYLRASAADIPGILAVQDDYYLPLRLRLPLSEAELQKAGFLVHKLKPHVLERLVTADETVVLVAKEEGEVVAYAVGYTLRSHIAQNPGWIGTIDLADGVTADQIAGMNAIYYRQEAVALKARGRKIGHQLNIKMAYAGMQWGCDCMIGEILEKPWLNLASYPKSWDRNARLGGISETWKDMALTWGTIRFGYGI